MPNRQKKLKQLQLLKKELAKYKFIVASQESLLSEYLKKQKCNIDLDKKDLQYLTNKKIIITGAGGTIGTALAKKLINIKIAELILIDNYENGLYHLKRTLDEKHQRNSQKAYYYLGDVTNQEWLSSIFAKHNPNLIFHYANYKSLVMGNIAPIEFVRINIGGTKNILDLIPRYKSIKKVLYISSDKAEQPNNIYGMTKRICEILIKSSAQKNINTRYGSLRYCNVLDSAGSFAISTFKDQISNNKTVTIRHGQNGKIPERYFITINNAVNFAITTMPKITSGEIFSLKKKYQHYQD